MYVRLIILRFHVFFLGEGKHYETISISLSGGNKHAAFRIVLVLNYHSGNLNISVYCLYLSLCQLFTKLMLEVLVGKENQNIL